MHISENELDSLIEQDLNKQDPASPQNSAGSQYSKKVQDFDQVSKKFLSLLERKDGPSPQIRGTPKVSRLSTSG